MSIPIPVFVLIAVVALSVFLILLNLSLWRIHPGDRAPLWLIGGLGTSLLFTLGRLLQYGPLSERMYILVPRLMLTSAYLLAWLGYEFANAFIDFRPRPREHLGIRLTVVALIALLWGTDMILTGQVVLRPVVFGSAFHGVTPGPYYLPAGLLVLALAAMPLARLMRAGGPHRLENRLLAAGYAVVILLSLTDILAVFLNVAWMRFSDLNYLPVAIFFSFIQVQRFAMVHADLEATVKERTAELSAANDGLRTEIDVREQAEAALQHSEASYRLLFDSNPQPAWVYDLETLAFLLVNDAAVARYGYSRREFLRMTIEDIRPADRTPALRQDPDQDRHEMHRTKDGSLICVELRSHELLFAGRPARLVIANDITDTVQANLALRESEEKYRTVVESANDGIAIIQEGLVKFVNSRLAELRGDAVANILGHRFDTFIHPDERKGMLQRYARRLAGYDEPTSYETMLLRLDGNEVPAELTVGSIHYQGLPAQIVFVRDISERKAAEQALQRQLREMAALNAVAVAGAESLQVDELIERITDAIDDLLYPDSCGVLLADEVAESWKPHPSYHGIRPEFLPRTYPFSRGIVGKVLTSRKAMRVGDVRAEPDYYEADSGSRSEVAAPIMVAGSVFGCLNAESKALNAFSEHDERNINTIAENMATAIQKIHLLQVEKRRLEEAEILYKTTRDLVVERNLPRLLNTIVERLAAMLGAPSGGLYLAEPERHQVRCAVSHNTARDFAGSTLRYGEGAAGIVAESGRALVIEDYRTWQGRASVFEQDQPFISVLAVPMSWQGRVMGVLEVLENTTVRQFSDEDLRMAMLFANQASIAVEHARLIEETSRRAREAAVIAEVGRDISETLELRVTLERIASYAKNLFRARTCAVYVPDSATLTLGAIAALGPFAEEIMHDPVPLGEGILGAIALQRSGEIVNRVGDDPRAIHVAGTEEIPVEHLMGVPVLSRGQLLGLIAVWRIEEGNEFNSGELDFLTSLAGQVAVAIQNARLFEDAEHKVAQLEILQSLAAALRAAETIEQSLPTVLDQLIGVLGIGSALVELLDSASGEIVSVLAHGVWAPLTGLRTPMHQGASSRVISTGQPYITMDLVHDGLVTRPDLAGGLNVAACVPIMAQHQPIGTLWVGREGPASFTDEDINLISAIGEMMGNTIHRLQLHQETLRQAAEIESAYDRTLEGWARALELRDKETEGHSRRVTDLTLQLARRLGVPEPDLIHMRRGVLLHDIGKMGITDQLLRKTGPLTKREWVEMRKHPGYAYDLLLPITYLHSSLEIPYCHHERWDGSGYPRGLKGRHIPLAARIFAVVDVYDALLYDRPYRKAWPHRKVLDYLREQSGLQFDPKVIEAFLSIVEDQGLHEPEIHMLA